MSRELEHADRAGVKSLMQKVVLTDDAENEMVNQVEHLQNGDTNKVSNAAKHT